MSITDNDFPTLVHRHGYRLTPQRQLVLNAIRETGGHASVHEIQKRVRKHSKAISLPTIYRTLDFLCELRAVVAIQIGRHLLYEIPGERPHHHVICRNCGSVEMVSNEEVQAIFSRIEQDHGFVVDMEHLGLFGLCAECRKDDNIS